MDTLTTEQLAQATPSERERYEAVQDAERAKCCQGWTRWMRSAWAELSRNDGLAAITHYGTMWAADHSDTDAECPYCGHTLTR